MTHNEEENIPCSVAATVTGRHKSFEKRKPPQFFHPPVHALNQYRATLSGDTACRPLQELQNYIPHTAIDQERRLVPARLLLPARFAEYGVSLEQSERIGSGRYSKVLTAHLTNGTTVAIKTINLRKVTSEFRIKFLPREIECWRRLKHPHIVRLFTKEEAFGRVFLLMEYGSRGDLVNFYFTIRSGVE